VCLDDVLFLVPLDALPLGGGTLGDAYSLHLEVSCARLLDPATAAPAPPTLLALGGASYDAEGSDAALPAANSAPLERGARAGGFPPLPETEREVESVGQLFRRAFGAEPRLLRGTDATKSALHEHAPSARFLHVATHGWFAPESVRSVLDPPPARALPARTSAEEAVTGLAPLTLAGLALAGANRGLDPLGRVPGILTAEELCGIDLSSCALAVLSACETSVGLRRAGQGVQSLQAALHAAGARTALTSLWKVEDAATRELMEGFYDALWTERLPVHRALWQAKQALRSRGAPLRDWAGWVLTGDPR
jgi:CHAT domain-containing protein